MYRKKVLQALKVHLRRVGVFTVERRRGEKGLFGYSWIVLDLLRDVAPVLAEDVQVDRRGFSQSIKDFLNVFDVQSLLRFSLPAA